MSTAKQAAENLYSYRSSVGIDKDRYNWEEAESIIQQAIDTATAKLELELQRSNAKCAEQAAATAKSETRCGELRELLRQLKSYRQHGSNCDIVRDDGPVDVQPNCTCGLRGLMDTVDAALTGTGEKR